ncbi:potassium channel family protein [Roseivirga sp.]|uniref:potassium channel family protein n=1 Tax=Roseivirga sp. TaxID=1964215 RepID=UPI002B2658FB|nr:potassium channel family protein [Roseivirga sp.]
MKKHLPLAVLLLFTSFSAFAQENINYKKLSFAQFFEMVEMEEDTVFSLSDAIISYNPNTDSLFTAISSSIADPELRNAVITRQDTLLIDKELLLDNVHFKSSAVSISRQNVIPIFSGFQKVIFKRKVTMTNCVVALFNETTFEEELSFTSDDRFKAILTQLKEEMEEVVQSPFGEISISQSYIYFTKANFTKGINLEYGPRKAWGETVSSRGMVEFVECKLLGEANAESQFFTRNKSLKIEDTVFDLKSTFIIRSTNTSDFTFNNNIVKSSIQLDIISNESQRMNISNNTFHKYVILNLDNYQNGNVEWDQWVNKVVDNGYRQFIDLASTKGTNLSEMMNTIFGDSTLLYHQTHTRIENKSAHKSNIRLLTEFYNQYKLQHDTENANLVYTEIKDLETQRLRYSYLQSPNFEAFFTWKINQFLALFSAYGTKPAKAIVFSMKVILAFALVYLFFPNYWDSHGKNRIMDRYRFFLKYVNRDSGIHEVYLEEQKQDLLNAEDFKTYLLEQGKTAPKFFMATAMPLYKWSVAGTRTFSWFLEKIDFLKGKWSETEPSKQGGKSVLLITAFLIALTYDIFIKMLNALMLSINTFTTLGFGEIPIKGLPRYLAIIQGFIGWFMLTIFSVSLISQLLN